MLVSADYSQFELRLLAHVSDIPQLKQAFADGIDIHARTASEMFGVPVEGMPKEILNNAKAINFGIIYGISAFGLARNLGIGREEAGAYIKRYFERFPGIRDYMETTKTFARANGYVKTIFGRRVWVVGIKSKNPLERAFAERQSINAPLQGAAADIIRRAMVRLPDTLSRSGLKARILLQVHDELVFEAPKEEARVTTVRLEIGALSHVEPDALRFCFDAVTRGSLAESAVLEIITTPGRAWCMPCGDTVDLARLGEACPRCGSYQMQVAAGDEMRVSEIEIA